MDHRRTGGGGGSQVSDGHQGGGVGDYIYGRLDHLQFPRRKQLAQTWCHTRVRERGTLKMRSWLNLSRAAIVLNVYHQRKHAREIHSAAVATNVLHLFIYLYMQSGAWIMKFNFIRRNVIVFKETDFLIPPRGKFFKWSLKYDWEFQKAHFEYDVREVLEGCKKIIKKTKNKQLQLSPFAFLKKILGIIFSHDMSHMHQRRRMSNVFFCEALHMGFRWKTASTFFCFFFSSRCCICVCAWQSPFFDFNVCFRNGARRLLNGCHLTCR